jgi:hypothetical protein
MKYKIKTLVLVLIISIFSLTTFASNTTGEEDLATFTNPGDPGGDPGASPINDYLLPMLLLGVILGYRLLKNKNRIGNLN